MWHGVMTIVILYAALIGCMALLQRRLMYYPAKAVDAPHVYGLATMEEVFITTGDNVKLQAWVHAAKAGFPTILYFHGNAMHLGVRAYKFAAFAEAGFGVVAVSYRGFGKSAGRPSEQGIYSDARAAVDYAIGTLKLPPQKLIYYGESLGSGVAVQMATERAPGLLALEAAYTSVETRSAELYPFVVGVRRLVRDKYDSLAKIKNIRVPLLMLHGQKDATIPIRHGQTLFAAAYEPKEMVVYPEVNHADFSAEQVVAPLLQAAGRHKLIELM